MGKYKPAAVLYNLITEEEPSRYDRMLLPIVLSNINVVAKGKEEIERTIEVMAKNEGFLFDGTWGVTTDRINNPGYYEATDKYGKLRRYLVSAINGVDMIV